MITKVRRGLSRDWQTRGTLRLMTGGSDIGTLGVLALGRTFATTGAGMGVDVFAFATIASSVFVNRDVGVTEVQGAASGLPVTVLEGGCRSFGVQAASRWRPGRRDRWPLQAELGVERCDGGPITIDDFEADAGIALFYRF